MNKEQKKIMEELSSVCEGQNWFIKKFAFIDGYKAAFEIQQKKIDKLKSLMLLTDSVVSDEEISRIAVKQWNEFIRVFPEEMNFKRES